MSDRRYFVAEETIERLDGRFDAAVEFVHDREREEEAHMEIAYDLSKSYSFRQFDEGAASEILAELKQSPAYESFTEEDRANVQLYVSRITCENYSYFDDEPTPTNWSIMGDTETEGRLFPTQPIVREIYTKPVDVALLTGWGGLDVLKASDVDINDFQDYGCNSRLQLLQLLGALSSQKARDLLSGSETFRDIKTGKVTKRIYMGGDVHFDFYMGVKERYPDGAIDPIGIAQDFSPDGCHDKRVACYHSVEDALMYNLLFWAHELGKGLEDLQLETFRTAAINAINNVGSTGSMVFRNGTAEHFDDDLGFVPSDLLEYFKEAKPREDGSKSIILGNMVGKTIRNDFMTGHVEADGSFSLRYHYANNGEVSEVHRFTFNESELVPMIELSIEHAYRGLGRTTITQLLSLIAIRFFPEQFSKSDDMGYYERRKKLPQLAAQLVLGIEPVSEGDK